MAYGLRKYSMSPWSAFALFGIVILAFIGWIMNIYKLVTTDPFVINGEVIVQVIGIFIAPLGAVLGWVL